MNTPDTVDEVSKAHASTHYQASSLVGPLVEILEKSAIGWPSKKIANYLKRYVPPSPYTTVRMVECAQRDLGMPCPDNPVRWVELRTINNKHEVQLRLADGRKCFRMPSRGFEAATAWRDAHYPNCELRYQ